MPFIFMIVLCTCLLNPTGRCVSPLIAPIGDSTDTADTLMQNYISPGEGMYIVERSVKLLQDTVTGAAVVTLYPGDSVNNLSREYSNYAMPQQWYKLEVMKNNTLYSGYVRGKALGNGIQVDVNGDGIADMLAARYLSYNVVQGDADGLVNTDDQPAEILVISAGNIISHFPFKANNSIELSVFNTQSFPAPVKCFLIKYGYEACGYINQAVVIYWNGKEIKEICGNAEMSDAGVVYNYCTYIYPEKKAALPTS